MPDAPVHVLEATLARPPALSSARLVCIDGPAGSGKTTLADRVAGLARARGLSTSVVHFDDLYDGWGGLPAVGELVRAAVLEPLASGRPGSYRRYDWHREEYAETRPVDPADLVILEGVGSGHPSSDPWRALLVWVDAPVELRLRRGLERDGAQLEPQWRVWLESEAAVHARDRTRERADLVVDGVTGAVDG